MSEAILDHKLTYDTLNLSLIKAFLQKKSLHKSAYASVHKPAYYTVISIMIS